jgi:putative ABC transport system permease protein
MDIYAARETFGKGDHIDRIDLTHTPYVETDKLAEDLQAQLPAGIRVERPSLRGQALESTVSSMNFGLTIMSFLALTICVFLIFNSFSISLNQRWKEIGILRAIGVKRRGVRLMFLGESVLLGLIGSIIGVVGGYFLAMAAIRVVARVSTTMYGVVSTPQELTFDTEFALEAFAVGMIVSLFAAWLPARAAAKLRPVLALTNVETRQSEQGINKARIAVGFALVILGLLLIRFTRPQVGMNIQLFYSVLMQIGMILLLPMFIRLGARVIRPVLGRLFGVEGVIAVESMAASPRRTVATVGALMIGLSFVIAHAAFIQSQKAALDRSLDKTLSSDMLVSSSEQIQGRAYHFSDEVAQKIAAMPEIEIAAPMRVASFTYGGEEISLSAHEMDKYFASSPDLLDFGDPVQARAATARGEGALISTNFSLRTGLGLGDRLKIDAPNGTIELPIVGMLDYFRSQKGTVFIDRSLYKKYWNDSSVDYVFIDLKPGVDRAAFKQKLQQALSGEHAFVYTHDEFKAWVTRLIDQFFSLTYLQMVIAIFVAAIGLVNTMVISVSERRREIGIFRAVGGLRRQVAEMVMLEAVAIGLIGLFTGAIMGLLGAYFLVNTAAKVVAGFTVELVFPWWIVLASVPLVLAVAAISAFVPSFNASRIHVAEAIGYE